MFGNRDQIRQVFIDVHDKLRDGLPLQPLEAQIAELLREHPEYDALLADAEQALGKDFDGEANPYLHLAMHLSLREQVQLDRPGGIRELHRLLSRRLGQHPAEHAMMECLGQALWKAQTSGLPPDDSRYLDCLKKLT